MKSNQNLMNLPYRACVGVALFNEHGKVFVGERIDTPGAWQMPQGGIDPAENIEQAAFRELKEEIGTDNATAMEMIDHTLRYDLPEHLLNNLWGGKYRGQEQYWIAMRFDGKDDEINLDADDHPEFSQWQWVNLKEVPSMIVPFKRHIYDEVIGAFGKFSNN